MSSKEAQGTLPENFWVYAGRNDQKYLLAVILKKKGLEISLEPELDGHGYQSGYDKISVSPEVAGIIYEVRRLPEYMALEYINLEGGGGGQIENCRWDDLTKKKAKITHWINKRLQFEDMIQGLTGEFYELDQPKYANEIDRCDSYIKILLGEDMPTSAQSFISSKTHSENILTKEKCRSLLEEVVNEVIEKSTLTPREHQVVGLRFGIVDGKNKTFSQIGAAMGFSESTAIRIERLALNKLKLNNPGT